MTPARVAASTITTSSRADQRIRAICLRLLSAAAEGRRTFAGYRGRWSHGPSLLLRDSRSTRTCCAGSGAPTSASPKNDRRVMGDGSRCGSCLWRISKAQPSDRKGRQRREADTLATGSGCERAKRPASDPDLQRYENPLRRPSPSNSSTARDRIQCCASPECGWSGVF